MPSFWPVSLVVVSAVVYHLALKGLGGASSPWPALALAYGTAFVVTVVLATLGDGGLRVPGRAERHVGLLIGIAAVGIETGFFLAYRAGWRLATASVVGNLAVTAILVGVGAALLGEHLTPSRALGLVLAAPAALLLAR